MPYQTIYVPPQVFTITPEGTYYYAYDDGDFDEPYMYWYQFVPTGEEYNPHEEPDTFDIREFEKYDPSREKEIRDRYPGNFMAVMAEYHDEVQQYHREVIHQTDNFYPETLEKTQYVVEYTLKGVVEVASRNAENAARLLGDNQIMRRVSNYDLYQGLERQKDAYAGFEVKAEVVSVKEKPED